MLHWQEKEYTNEGEADDEHIARHKNTLANVLETFELGCLNVSEDGDCLFTSVAMYIEQLLSSNSVLPQLLLNHFQSIGVISTVSKLQLIRELLVHEWLCNQGEYQPFFCGTVNDFEESQ